MGYRPKLVNVDIDGPINSIVKLAIDLAIRCNAKLIGFCAADARMPMMGPEGGALAAEVWSELKEDITHRFKELHAEFEQIVDSSVEAEWITIRENPTRSLSASSSLADLVITGALSGVKTGDNYRIFDPGSAVLQSGRPMLIAATGAERVLTETVVIAWKNTREARRAVIDAVPLLRSANEVTIVTVVSEVDDRIRIGINDVAAFLIRHGINVITEVIESNTESELLRDFLISHNADLVISGAYVFSPGIWWIGLMMNLSGSEVQILQMYS